MNLLTISKKRAVSKIKETDRDDATAIRTKYFGYKKKVVTSWFDARNVLTTSEKVEKPTDERISEILNDKRY